MAESMKRSVHSSSKTKKSKNEVIRSAVGMYLKQRNYTSQDRYRKSDLNLTQTREEMVFTNAVQNDTSRSNAFLYYNVFCINPNSLTQVDQQFARLSSFIQSLNPPVRNELQSIMPPLLCHLYIEMLKGPDWRLAIEFLRKYASIVAPVDTTKSQLTHKLNGSAAVTLSNDDSVPIASTSLNPLVPNGSPYIVFQSESDNDSENLSHKQMRTRESFKELIQTLSTISRKQDIDTTPSVASFRSCKYKIKLSSQSLYALKRYLAQCGHVLILQILQFWFHIETIVEKRKKSDRKLNLKDNDEHNEVTYDSDEDDDDEDDEEEDDDYDYIDNEENNDSDNIDIEKNVAFQNDGIADNKTKDNDVHNDLVNFNDVDLLMDGGVSVNGCNSQVFNSREQFNSSDFSSYSTKNINTPSRSRYDNFRKLAPINQSSSASSTITSTSQTVATLKKFSSSSSASSAPTSEVKRNEKNNATIRDEVPSKEINFRLKNLRDTIGKLQQYQLPVRVHRIDNADKKLSCASMDPSECHVVSGFEDSNITLWSMYRSHYYGRKPWSTCHEKSCDWSLTNCDRSSDEHNILNGSIVDIDDSGDDEDDDGKYVPKFYRKVTKKERWRNFMGKRCSENIFSDSGGLTLRGHSKAVTDVLFSVHNPLFLSVSRDLTMRAWKATDYNCVAVYRGHNYPIWCVAESSNGLYVATGSKDSTARLWATDREYPLKIFTGHTQDVDAIAFHPNGNYLATGSTDLTVRLWCVTSGKLLRVFTECKLPVQTIAFSPDGKLLAAGGDENRVRIFDLAAGSQLTELKDNNSMSSVKSITWSLDSKKLASASTNGTIRIWDVSKIGVGDIQVCSSSSTSIPSTSTSAPGTNNLTTSTSASSTSNNLSLLMSYATGCKRLVKIQCNSNNTFTCIGNN